MLKKQSPLPSQLSDVNSVAQDTGADFQSRRIYLIGNIDEESSARFLVAFHTMDDARGPITIVLCSSGGDEASGYAIYDTLRLARNPVTIMSYGECMSVAALILQGATTRLLAPECQFMIHNGHVNMSGDGEGGVQIDADDMIRYAAEVKKNNHRYHVALSERSGTDIATVKKWCEAETFMSAKETVARGFADGILARTITKKRSKPSKNKGK